MPRAGIRTRRIIQSGCASLRFLPNDALMKDPVARFRSLPDLRALTPARVALGRSGVSLPTEALLAFELDHARARDAVHAAFDTSAVTSGLGELGLSALLV